MRRIELHTRSARIAKIVAEEFTEKGTTVEVVKDAGSMPEVADLVVSTAKTNAKDEWTAARLGCMVAVLPEALGYLRRVLDDRGHLVLVGADRGKA
ncbi:hypothetical protein [Rhodococcus jostii]|uniref:hypothetical protein n=1 Tax=Rhodococcus jostii TaxID=132919 RepID=UPI00363A710B